jgi:hypothetical protein
MVTELDCMGDGPTSSSTWNTVYPDSAGHTRMGTVMQHDDTPREHAKMLPLDGVWSLRHIYFHTQHTFSHEFQLVHNPWHQGIECQFVSPVRMDYTPEMPAFNCVILFPFAVMHIFCCTAHGR